VSPLTATFASLDSLPGFSPSCSANSPSCCGSSSWVPRSGSHGPPPRDPAGLASRPKRRTSIAKGRCLLLFGGVLRGLRRHSAQTVPNMARMRPVSRQHIQELVNRLHATGLVEFEENPAHRRSHLVRLTLNGQRKIGDKEDRERRLPTCSWRISRKDRASVARFGVRSQRVGGT
jgi:MarR family